jgi:hypothetical protein
MLQHFNKHFLYDADEGKNGSPPAAEPPKTDNEPMIPKSRFDEVNNRAKAAEERLAKLESERTAENEKRLVEQEQWKQLAEERAQKLAEAERKALKADAYEEEMQSWVESTMNNIPDEYRSFVPDGSVEQQFKWLKKNYEKIAKPAAPPVGAGQRGAGGNPQEQLNLSEEEIAMAKKYGMTPEEYAKHK